MSSLHPDLIQLLKKFFAAEPEVKFAYLFGSQARQTAGPLSDLDLAVYLDEQVDLFASRLRIMEALAKTLGSERFDLVVLNRAPLVLRFEVIRYGIVLKDAPEQRVEFETEVLRQYLDTIYLRRVHREYLKDSLLEPADG
jgi:uncharacterized protein